MNRFVTLALAAFLALPSPALAESLKATGTVEAYFSPNGGAEAAVVRELDRAKSEVLIHAYAFTNRAIARAIIEAKKRGLKVEAVLDKSNLAGRYSAATFLKNAGVPVLIDSAHPINHNKVIIIDRQTLITGSMNFTAQGERANAENMLVLRGNPALLRLYLADYDRHKAHSE